MSTKVHFSRSALSKWSEESWRWQIWCGWPRSTERVRLLIVSKHSSTGKSYRSWSKGTRICKMTRLTWQCTGRSLTKITWIVTYSKRYSTFTESQMLQTAWGISRSRLNTLRTKWNLIQETQLSWRISHLGIQQRLLMTVLLLSQTELKSVILTKQNRILHE